MKNELVRDWMTVDVVTVTPETTLPEAHYLMRDNRIRRLPVVDQGRLVGIVTLGDIREAEPSSATSLSIWEINYLLSKIKIEELMTPHPYHIVPGDSVVHAAKMMLEHKVGALPVVEGGKLVGIITESDIFRMVVQTWEKQEKS